MMFAQVTCHCLEQETDVLSDAQRLAGDSPLPVPHVFVPASLPSEDRWN